MPALAFGTLPLDLKGRIDAILAKASAPLAIACLDLLNATAWAVEGDRSFPAGQLGALPLLMHAYEATQREEIDLESLRPTLIRSVVECDGTAITQLSERLAQPVPERMTASSLLAQLASLDADTPLWELLAWEGDRTKFPRRLPRVPMAYKAADRCEPRLAHAAGRLGGKTGILLVIMTEGDPSANSLIGRIAKAVWDHHQDLLYQQEAATEALDALRIRRMPDARLGVWQVQATWKDGSLRLTGESTLPPAALNDPELPSDVAILRGEPARVTAPVLNLRREPRHGAELLSQAPMGTTLHVLSRPEGEWWRVQSPDGYVSWARAANLRLEGDGGNPQEAELRILPAVLAAPRHDGRESLPLAAGAQLTIRERLADGWLAETPEGVLVRIGKEAALAASERPSLWRNPPELGKNAVAIAERWLGIPYLWGGKSGWGMDCSGLTQLVYELLGVLLPRDADQQARALPPVASWQELIPGDLLFYPGHVALWAGEGAVIHASSPRGAVVREEVSRVPWLQERCTAMGRPVLPS